MKFKSVMILFAMLCLVQSASARIISYEKQEFDLDDPSTGNNVFTTIFSFTPTLTGVPLTSAPIQVDYEDPLMTGIKANLVIDFTDLENPVVQTVEFDGDPGDIEHAFPQSSVNIGGFTAIPDGIKGFLRTQSGPIPVNTDGSFPAGNTNLIARQGTVTIVELGNLEVPLSSLPLGEFNDPISDSGDLNSIEIVPNLGLSTPLSRVYDLTIISELDNTLLTFPTSAGDLVFNIDGVFRGTSQVTVDIPEPNTLASALIALGLIGMRRRS